MGSSEKFCLRWNDFESNISVAFRELREDKDFFDVTLACDDDQIQAHKVILSACSPFFRTVLKRNRHEHPLLYLKGVKYTDLMAVLNFMYHGEVNVAQEELNSFLAIAEDLKVKGLTQNKAEEVPRQQHVRNLKPHQRELPEREEPTPHLKKSRPVTVPEPVPRMNPIQSSYQGDDDIQEVVPVKTEPAPHPPEPHHLQHIQEDPQHSQLVDPNLDNSMAMYEDNYADYDNYEEGNDAAYDSTMVAAANADGNKDLDQMINDSMVKDAGDSGVWRCLMCNVSNRQKARIRNHVETHFEAHQICPVCNQVCKSRESLRKHLARRHGDGQPINQF